MKGRKNKKCKIRIFLFILFLIASTAFLPFRSFGGDMEILLDKLVGKGILTQPEAEGILKEMKETKEMEKGKPEVQGAKTEIEPTKAEGKKVESPEWVKNLPDWIINPPDWIKNIKLSGDLRLRYEYDHRDTTTNHDPERNRARFRWRLGAESKIIDDVTMGFGLASGSSTGDPRTLDQTFDSSFSKKPLSINYAFAQYKPFTWFSLLGGKLRTNPIFRADSVGPWPSELVWDNDITPEGAAVVLNYPGLLNLDMLSVDIFMNDAVFLLDENSPSGSGREPYFYVIQPGFNLKIMKDINLKAALAKYWFNSVKDQPQLKFSANSNTLLASGKYKFHYDSLIGTAEFGYKNPVHQNIVPYVGLFGEYVYNPHPNKERMGYIGGIRVGYPSIKKFADWQLSYAYRRLEKDAWLDIFPDSTFYSGATNVKGHKAAVYFGLAKNLFCDVNYFHSVNILENTTFPKRRPEDILQTDIQFNF